MPSACGRTRMDRTLFLSGAKTQKSVKARPSQTAHHYRSDFFFFNDTATTEIYTLSLPGALPIWITQSSVLMPSTFMPRSLARSPKAWVRSPRSEEHTSELQSLRHLVCRLLL